MISPYSLQLEQFQDQEAEKAQINPLLLRSQSLFESQLGCHVQKE